MSKTSVKQFHIALANLGFKSYLEYLQSPHWKEVKGRYKKSKMPKTCRVCKKPYQVLHHRTYKRLGREYLMDLVALCHVHHRELHMKEDKNSRGGLWGQTKKQIRIMKKGIKNGSITFN